jgi:hypothetical protein
MSYPIGVHRFAIIFSLFVPLLRAADGPTAELGRRILDAGLDPAECYQVRNLRFDKEDLHVYLTEGYLIFGKAVDGVRLSAVFSGEVEGGDAELLLLPPTRSERMSLASYAHTPNLSEHFDGAILIFTDDTYAQLLKQIQASGEPRKSAERGLLLAQSWAPAIRNFSSSFQIRLVKDLLAENRAALGFFYMAVSGRKLGNFDATYDPRAREQINLGQVAFRQEQAYFDVWTRFQARSFRSRTRALPEEDLRVTNYHIDATLDPNLHLRVVTQATVSPGLEARRALSFDISAQMRVTEARINGEPAEVFQPSSLRSNLIRGDLNETFLVVPAKPLQPGREYQVEFQHEGDVISDAGNHVYFVGARGSWYPHRPGQFARYDLTFRYPEDLDLVATGKTVEDSVSSPWHVTRHRTDSAVRMAGFNLGRYDRQTVARSGYTVDVYANRTVETALDRSSQQRVILLPQPRIGPPGNQRWTVDLAPYPLDMPEIDPAARLQHLALEIAGALEFMASHFGPPVQKHLTIAPIPGTFGQGFPGLIYLSTLAYLDPKHRPAAARTEVAELFYSEILHAHETAHQWWGNVVTTASYEDDWIMEALANYSALLYLEKRKGIHAVDTVLASYKTHLLAKTGGGNAVDSIGPIIWGPRLHNSQAPGAWRVITYEKGSWIMHMLRQRMGEERFLAMLGQFRQHYQFQAVTTDQFRRAAAEGLPPRFLDAQLEAFFDQWVYGTGVPALKLNYKVIGKAPAVQLNGTITQSEVAEDFSALVPVEIQVAKGKPLVRWVRTASEPVSFSVTLKQTPTKVLLDPNNSVLRK